MDYMVAAYTDAGIKYHVNQDSLCLRRVVVPEGGELVMAVLCDGMGGMQKGEVASAACVDAFGHWFDRNLRNFHLLCNNDFAVAKNEWLMMLQELHERIQNYSHQVQVSMGTTVVALLTYKDRFLTVTVGDSRLYERKNALVQLSQDQSLVAREIALGRITEDEARHHPQRNVLLQCLGAGKSVAPVFTVGHIHSQTLYLLCSDGMSHELSREELDSHLQPVFFHSKDALTQKLCQLTELCKSRGEDDNISAILIKSVESALDKELPWYKKLFRRRDNDEFEHGAKVVETAQVTHTQETIP